MELRPPRDFGGVFRTDDAARAVYAEAAGIGRALPRAVAVPRRGDDVAALLRWARGEGVAIVPRGSGSSMAGGAIGAGMVTVDLSRLRGEIRVDQEHRTATASAGMLRGEVERAARAAGLSFPVDPSSGEFCTIGGMASTNAAGPHSLLHGAMRPWVRSIEGVFEDGSIATIRRGQVAAGVPAVGRFMRDVHPDIVSGGEQLQEHSVLKESSGYACAAYAQSHEIVDLLVGSEGTLAVFTAFELALIPEPGARGSLLVAFRDLEAAVTAAVRARELGAAACELLDRTFLSIAARGGNPLPVPADSDAALLVEVEASDTPEAQALVSTLGAQFRALGATEVIAASTREHAAELWSFRHAASPALARMDPSLRSMQFIEDAAVPPSALPRYVRGVRAILERNDTPGVIFGHAGDAHVHVNPLVDVGRDGWRERVERILLDVTMLVAELGGTLTGEHGDGRLRTPLLDRVWPAAALDLFRRIKDAFDPAGILNPGVKVPLRDQRAIDAIKYDPAASALPPTSRAALDAVERERAYGRFRLDLL